MADLFIEVVQRLGVMPIMPPNQSLFVNHPGETSRLIESLIRSITLLVGVNSEVLISSANTVSRILDQASVGEVAFVASAGHTTVTSYTARLRVSGNSTVVATSNLGKPTPDGNNVIIVDLTTFFNAQTAGNYTLSILATDPGGSTDSAESTAFALPLP